ncbi:2'-5' RNA ligase family protein [Pleomorphovibrio marinus]|uniref:2'-5' RNA ligase family protein n=1 Tax=Pleomorphovibrio marinus TaxID=2164132 RepID=UPI000E0A055C|nr:mutarotase [Pleomorphovibrio marinus]
MDISAYYDRLHEDALKKILSSGVSPDPLIDDPVDDRYGLTLLARPSPQAWAMVENFLQELTSMEPDQYYYGFGDAHVTIMPIISCEPGFSLEKVTISDYFPLIADAIRNIPPFWVSFQGVVLSSAAIMVKGYPQGDPLNRLRENLRLVFADSDLPQSLDKRYKLQTAHSTVLRFRQPLKNQEHFLKAIEKSKERLFGSFKVQEFEFVFNDWYQRKEKVKLLKKYSLE